MTFPVSLTLTGLRCLVVGAGAEAERRVSQFERAGATVHWVTGVPPTHETFANVSVRGFCDSDLEDAWLVVLADTDPDLAERIGTLCKSARIFYCAIDQPLHNSFSHMALIDAAPVTLAISTGGQAPALARKLSELLSRLFTPQVRAYFKQLAEQRRAIHDSDTRRAAMTAALAGFELDGAFKLPLEPVNPPVNSKP